MEVSNPLRFYESEPLLRASPRPTIQRAKSVRTEDKRKKWWNVPDGGRAWLVAFCVLVINLISAGMGRNFGILFVEIMEEFDVDRGQASLPFSLFLVVKNLIVTSILIHMLIFKDLLVGILGSKYGVRLITLVGGIICTASLISCYYVPNVAWLTLLYGGLNGLGACLATTLLQLVIQEYFVKYRATATGLAFSGGCIGSLLFPVLLEYLLNTYGIRKSFLLMGCMISFTIPLALLLKKPAWLNNQNDNKEISEYDKDKNAKFGSSTLQTKFTGSKNVPPNLEFIKHELGPDLSELSYESHIWVGLEDIYLFIEAPVGKFRFHKNVESAKRSIF
ncbi:hypothetical protein CEXT_352851 [Caerostris extrusa]|uniref:Major facilitator superfamily (MFS) profile domain-containing protein n=1 Tax=Caerostris extrusa TaxID=172846 RepID=A0AAV4MHI6_CAEEX|nr:hypothetical protein CEXT_352851 [Caerostris extrusa]